MEQASKGIQVFMNYDHNSVAYFHDKYTLSFDGFPECGSFVFEAISDAYDKEDKNTAENGSDDEGNEEEEEEDVLSSKRSILGDRMLTLQEKQMVIGITDASALVARRLLQHFMLNSSSTSMSIPRDFFLTDASNHRQKHLKIMGAVGSNNQTDIIESISLITSQERVSSIFLNVRASADGHLIVLNSQLAAVVSQQDILKRERKRSSVEKISIAGKLNGVAKENGGLTLQQLREYKFYHNTEVEKPNVSTEQKLPVLASDANEGKNKHKKCPPKRVGTGVLMLSEALDIIQETQSNQKKSLYQQQPSHARAQSNRMKAKSVVIRFAEEDWVTSFRLPQRARAELRSLWLRLISALEVARYETADSSDISNKNQQHHITILSRHLQIIRFFRQKQPVWTFLKDLRLCNSLSQRVRKFPFYARYTDGILVDQEALLSCSRNEMQLILNSAQKCRLKLLVANRKDLFQDGVMDQSGTFSFVQKDFKETKSFQVNVRESFDYNLGLAEKETIIKDFMILDLLGVEGAMTWYTDLGVEAMEQIMKKTSPMFTLAEDTLKGWRCGDLQSFKKRIRRRNAIHNVNRVNDKEFDDGDELRDLSEASELSADEKDFESEVRKQIHHHCIQHVEKNSSIVLSRPAHPKTINQVIQNGNDHHNVPQSKINPSRKVNIVAPNTQAIFLDIPVKQEKEHYKSQEQKQTGAGASAPAFTIHLKPRLPHTKNDPKGQSPRKKKVDVQIECVPHKNELLNLFLTNQMSQRQINDEQSPYRVSGARTNS
jgi:hypothetical protein